MRWRLEVFDVTFVIDGGRLVFLGVWACVFVCIAWFAGMPEFIYGNGKVGIECYWCTQPVVIRSGIMKA